MPKLELTDLIHPFTIKEFLRSHWLAKPLALHQAHSKLDFLLNHPHLQSLETLLGNSADNILATLPDFDDEYSSITLNAKDALKAYRNGMSLAIPDMHRQITELSECLANISRDLGLPEGELTRARSICYASPHGRGTKAHYDCNVNFVIQIRGKKTWRLAPNENVENPVVRHTIGTPISEELARHCSKPLPSKMPAKSLKVELKPGSMLFVPRGYWHETLADGESLSLNFTFNQPPWLEIFMMSVRNKLREYPKWRALANGVGSTDAPTRKEAMQRFSELLAGVVEDLSPLTSTNYFPKDKKFLRTDGLKLKIRGDLAFIFRKTQKILEFEVDEELKNLLSWIFRSSKEFSLDELRSNPACESDIVAINLVDELENAGILKRF